MEVKREEEVDVKPCSFSPSYVWIKAEPCDDVHDASGLAHGYMNTQDSGKCICMSKCEKDGVSFSRERKGISDNTSECLIKQEDCEFGKGVVVMRGEDFVVEVDPNYESGDELEMKSEVKVECESESGEMEMCVDSSGDMPGVPSKRQGSACLASSGEVAVDVRGRCGSSERSVRSNCGQSCVGAAVSAPSTANSSCEASVVKCHPGETVSALVQRNRLSGSEGEICPGCGKEGLPCQICMDVNGENLLVTESSETLQTGRKKNFACSECGKAFGRNDSVKRHVAVVHRREKRFSCSECGKSFGHSGNLKTHMATVHGDVRNFACSECGKAFGQRGNLKTHMATIHREERNFTCSECGKAFGQSGNLKRHMATVHRPENRPSSEST